MAHKICPKCDKKVGPRSLTCPSCSYSFYPKKEPKVKTKPLKKAKKTKITRRRRQRKPKEFIECQDWRELQPGEKIKVLQGTGPYYDTEQGRTHMGYSGYFTVKEVTNEGIIAYATKSSSAGYCFIYLENKIKTTPVGTTMRPHKIMRANPEAFHPSIK